MTMTFKEALIAHFDHQDVRVTDCHGVEHKFFDYFRLTQLQAMHAADSCMLKFRLAPRTILVNGVEVPAGENEPPSKGATYYVPDHGEESLAYDFLWGDDEMDARFLERGLVYLDKESAIARAKAMLITQEVK